MLTNKALFLAKYDITDREFEESAWKWEELQEIARDYESLMPGLEQIRKEFVSLYLEDKEKSVGLQSYHSRLKNPEHLVEKLIRKRIENYAKYRSLNVSNYRGYVTDLIGIRGLLLYREDWVSFHQYITNIFRNDPKKYLKNYADRVPDGASGYMLEPPKVHTRVGDFTDIYLNWIPEDNILDRKHYRAVHYILAYKGVSIEIQIRTLFEEGWGEIDHHILYPRRKDNAMLKEFSELLNRLAGMGDEMGSFYRRLQVVPEEEFRAKDSVVIQGEEHGDLVQQPIQYLGDAKKEPKTVEDIIYNILRE